MCYGWEIGLAIAAIVVAVATTTTTEVMKAQQAKAQKKVAKFAAELKRDQIIAQQALAAEVTGQRMFELAKAAQLAKGAAEAQGLADRSVAAIGRAIGFELGQDKATLLKNQEIAALEAGAQLRGVQLELDSQEIKLGDTSGLATGLTIGIASTGAIVGQGKTLIEASTEFQTVSTGGLSTSASARIPVPQISSGFTSAALSGRV